MISTRVDMQYGVRQQDDIGQMQITNTVARPIFNGLPVFFDDKLVSFVDKVKKWRRLNRLPKVRHQQQKRYGGYICKPPLVPTECVICHPEFEKHFPKRKRAAK